MSKIEEKIKATGMVGRTSYWPTRYLGQIFKHSSIYKNSIPK